MGNLGVLKEVLNLLDSLADDSFGGPLKKKLGPVQRHLMELSSLG